MTRVEDDPLPVARALADEIASRSPDAVRAAKRLYDEAWTGPAEVDGLPVEGTWRAHQVPLSEVRTNPVHLAQLEAWMHSYRRVLTRYERRVGLYDGFVSLACAFMALNRLVK